MYSKGRYPPISALAMEMSERYDNTTQGNVFVRLSSYCKKLADSAAPGFHPR